MAKKDKTTEPVETDQSTVEAPAETPVKETKPKEPTKAELAQKEANAVDFSDEALYGDGPWPKISRAAAVLLGFRRYYTGEVCKNGHDAPRKTKTSTCTACGRMKLRDRHKRKMQEDPNYRSAFNAKAKVKRAAKSAAKAAVAKGTEPQA